jgi:mannose-6-phosphate isomerase-like protein (cupin superfamily)
MRGDPESRVSAFTVEELRQIRGARSELYHEFLRRPDLSMGIYELPAGGVDPQGPHQEDEVYVVLGGRALLEAGGSLLPVQPGSVVFVPARMKHAFREITENLSALVFFGPAEST